MDTLKAFEAVDFQWTQSLDSVWRDSRYDVPSLHRRHRQAVLAKVQSMAESAETGSPLGWVFVGPAGYGKTHLLAAIRREIMRVPASFVLVDMIDVRDFWETVLLGFIDAVQRPVGEAGLTQGQLVVQHIVTQVRGGDGAELPDDLTGIKHHTLARHMDELVQRLGRTHRPQTLKHADTLRALVLLNSHNMELSNLGYAWLQGYGVAETAMEVFGFNIREKKPSAVVEGLSWLMSLRSPMVVALDHFDALVAEHHALASGDSLPEEHLARQMVSRNIIDNVGRGLMELRDVTRRALSVVACLEETWNILGTNVLKSTMHRFEDQRVLGSLGDQAVAEHLVESRLAAAYARVGFTPPYPRWPFSPAAFASLGGGGLSPRELLHRCEQHRRACIETERVTELTTFDPDEPPRSVASRLDPAELAALDRDLERLRASAKIPARLRHEDGEDDLGKLLLAGCELVIAELAHDPTVDLAIDAESGGTSNYVALHARVRQIFNTQNDRERHICLRVILRDHHIAFQARLTAALTASGIDRKIPFRKLILVRNAPVPTGAKGAALMAKARSAGAELHPAGDEDLLALLALTALRKEQKDRREIFKQWLRARRPASALALMKPVADWLAPSSMTEAPRVPTPTTAASAIDSGGTKPAPVTPAKTEPDRPSPAVPTPAGPAPVSPPLAARPMIAVGRQVIGDRLTTSRSIPAEDLRQHVVVLAGAGSGKTVLLRRLIEEAALLGIPSIVVDGANDLSRLGEPWPERPSSFTDEDAAKADRYHTHTDVVVWTPGRSNGNPLHLGLLPDFSAVAHDPDELNQVVAMTASTLAGMAGKKVDDKARAILDAALRVFAREGGGDLTTFLEVLADLPEEASLKISTARKVATNLCDSLRAAVQTNPLLHEVGEPLDPGVLFGLGSGRPRVSVLSLIGLPGVDAPLQFVNQLAMTLFTWVKKNPCPSDRPLRGLLVLDEAKDFVPSQSSTPCKESLIRLAAQGRKYGLGVVFASQAPKSIDHNVIANASTQFFGKASSPTAIETVEEQLRVRGATKSDVALLPRGRFYLAGKDTPAPIKIEMPLCLSHHPASPPDEGDVLRRAAASRARLG